MVSTQFYYRLKEGEEVQYEQVRRAIPIGLFITMPLLAQPAAFSQLAATDDGQQLYFISPLALAGPRPVPQPVSQSAPLLAAGPTSNLYWMRPDGIQLLSSSAAGPHVSSDGSIVGFTDPNFCTITGASTSCGQEAKLLGPPPVDLGPGTLQLSQNGRWALLIPPPAPNTTATATATLTDIASGVKTPIPSPPVGVTSAIASDGTVLVQQMTGNQLGLWRGGQFTPVNLGGPGTAVRPLALSDDAGTIIYSAFDISPTAPPVGRLVARNLAAGTDTTVFVSPEFLGQPGQPAFMGASDDGRVVLFRLLILGQLDTPAYVVTIGGNAQPILLPDGEWALDGTVSGSGNFAFLATTAGRILRVSLAGDMPGPLEELALAPPYFTLPGSLSPGEYVPLLGSASGTVQDLQGHILLDDLPLVVLAAKPGEVDVQVPWEQPTGQALFHLTVPTASPFEQDQTVSVLPLSLAFLTLPAGSRSFLGPIALVRGDFSGLQTTQPQSGDIVVAYMTGLGPVQGVPVTGQPAPGTPLFPIQGALTCMFTPGISTLETLFAGLAPGLIGIYQVSFRMPDDPNNLTPLMGMQCSLNGPGGSASFGFAVLGF